jgi:hypothetical protein
VARVPTPKITQAYFDDIMAGVVLVFDANTDQGGGDQCGAISQESMLAMGGNNVTCKWKSLRMLYLSLSKTYSLQPGTRYKCSYCTSVQCSIVNNPYFSSETSTRNCSIGCADYRHYSTATTDNSTYYCCF